MAPSLPNIAFRHLQCGLRAQHLKHALPLRPTWAVQTRSIVHSIPRASPANVVVPGKHSHHFGRSSLPFVFKAAGVASVGLGLSALTRPVVHCEDVPKVVPPPTIPDYPPPPSSSVSLYELSFGTVAGICAGVFIKKGAKAVAWSLGGIFVLLQYLSSGSMVKVDWGRMASRFENLFYTTSPTGAKKPPTVVSLWNWLVGFLTADFQPRASFLAGLVLGLRIG